MPSLVAAFLFADFSADSSRRAKLLTGAWFSKRGVTWFSRGSGSAVSVPGLLGVVVTAVFSISLSVLPMVDSAKQKWIVPLQLISIHVIGRTAAVHPPKPVHFRILKQAAGFLQFQAVLH